ncbi:MAG: TraR/DksA C4-type zinc finger protein [Alicyclobacillaceae bacterium]|nr:TraR/DksA C4-type zinc finger protein [Alicyclobacillaceae bacterium]
MTIWEEQRRQLEAEAADLRERLFRSGGMGLQRPMNDSVGELSGYDNHPADLGTEMFERGKDLALRESYFRRLDEVELALGRLQSGTYGNCLRCGASIGRERLQAEPAASLCFSCQTREDMSEGDDNRPVEERFLAPGFGRTFADELDQTGYDGEDAWQDVARYGTSSDRVRTMSLRTDDEGGEKG